MKINLSDANKGSVLIIALMTITILTMICATSLYIVSQNGSTGMQVAGWHQSLNASETGVSAAVRALNSGTWTNWVSMNATSLPTSEPVLPTTSPTATPASGLPGTGNYFLLPSTAPQTKVDLSNSEGATSASAWVTIDNTFGTNSFSSSGYLRVRSTGRTKYPTNSTILSRVSNNRLDNDLRNTIAMRFDRKSNGSSTNLGPTRTIEVILQPIASNLWGEGMYIRNKVTFKAVTGVDYFNSNTTSTANMVANPSVYRGTDYTTLVMGMANANGSDLNNKNIYGEVAYSTTGGAPANTSNVKGGLITPFNVTPPTTSDPTWTTGPDVTYNPASSSTYTLGSGNTSASNPYKIKVNGAMTMSGNTLTISNPGGTGTYYVELWTTGDFTMLAGGKISVDPGIHVTMYVDGKVDLKAGGVTNGSGLAKNYQIVVVGSGDVSCNAGTLFCGTIEAPNSDFSLTGGIYVGAIIANTMTFLGGTFHYDAALATTSGSSSLGNYAFASWFEDNSDPKRKDSNGNYIVY